MILLALLLNQAATATPIDTGTDDPGIVVMARKSGRWRGSWWTENGQATCKTQVSSGDAEIDAIGCTNLLICGPLYSEEMVALLRARQAAGTIRTGEEARRAALPAMEKIERCMDAKWRPALRELRQRRRTG